MSSENPTGPDKAKAVSRSLDAEDSPEAMAQGLPALTPDFIEEIHADEIDNIVPTHGYHQMPVLALGGSAGSIQALKAFFEAVPANTGQAYVVILHLSPEHDSTLPALLQATTAMPVGAAQDGERLNADQVYVIPPGKHLSVTDGHLRLSPLEPEHGKRVAVDVFLRSLADTHGPHAAAVVLSGADGDGASGLKRIKERGGLTVAQDPEEAEHPSMPRTAIETGMVDWVLPVAEMPARILEYRTKEASLCLPPEDGPQPAEPLAPPQDENEVALRDILVFLRTRTSHDFTYYKRATIVRRIARRMQVNGLDTMPVYLAFLRTHPGEAGALLQDLLISVTNFFRDRDAFAAVEQEIPKIFAGKGPTDTVRLWTAACATGEETYSLAMLAVEHARTLPNPPAVQVFGCDLDGQAIQTARAGLYPDSIATDVNEDRLARFFVKNLHGGYRVRRELREIVLFAEHDLLSDAPFSRLDLVSCRNLLIYLSREAQRRAFEIFHFALQPHGRLFLGTSETVDEEQGLFTALDKKHRLYARLTVPRIGLPVPTGTGALVRALQGPPVVAGAAFTRGPDVPFAPPFVPPLPSQERAALTDLHFRLVERYAPPSVVVNEQHDIVHLSAHAGRFLQFVGGQATTNLLRTVNPLLRLDLRAALFRATETNAPVEVLGIPVELDGAAKLVDLRAAPAAELAPGYLLVTFTTRDPDATAAAGAAPARETGEAMRHLEAENESLRRQLRDTVEQYEASAEEYRASHEELQSMNEELRSASEELETSREELQSINEELNTVNAELKSNVEELGHFNSDLHNLMNATSIVTVFLDRELKVTRFTPNAAELFFLIPTDVGRPLEHVKLRLDYPDLIADAQKVLRTLVPVEREVDGTGDQRWFLVQLQPYRTTEDHIGGLVLTFVDITERKRAEEALRRSEDLRRIALAGGRMGTWRWDLRTRQVWGDPDFFAFWGLAPSEDPYPISATVSLMSAEGAATVEALMARKVTPDEEFDGQIQIAAGASAGRWVRWRGRAERETPWIVNGISFDVTEQRQADERLLESETQFRSFVDATSDTVYKMSADWTEMRYLGGKRFLADTTDPSRTWLETYIPAEDRLPVITTIQEAIRDKRTFEMEHRVIRADGTEGWTFSRAIPLLDARGEIREWMGAASDITERKLAEAARHRTEERLRLIVNSATDYAIFTLDLERRVTSWSPGAQAMLGYGEADILGQPGDLVFTPEDRADNAPVLEVEKARRVGRAENERYHLRRDGSRFYGSGLSMPLCEDDGTLIGFVKIMRDLSEAKRAEDALRANEARLHTAVTIVQLGTCDWDYLREEVRGNAQRFHMFGLDPALEVVSMRQIVGMFHPEDREQVWPRMTRQIEGSGELVATYRIVRPDGTLRWIAQSGRVTARRQDGWPLRIESVLFDITTHHEAEAAIHESETRFRTLADAVPQVIWANEATGKANYFNGRWFEYSGLSLEESVGPGWQAIVHPEDAPASQEKWQRALTAGAVFDTEYRLRRADGVYRWHVGRNVPLKDEAGHVLGWFGSATDIEDLFQARAEAQAANVAKDHFLAVLSHELRTPLMPITMALGILSRRQDLPEAVKRTHEMIKRNVQLESRFIDDMLDVTRIARGKMEIVPREMELHEAIKRAVEVSSSDLEAKGQSLTVTLDAANDRLSGDSARLQQVFWNLFKNASKFTPEGGAIRIRSRNEPGRIVVEVTDSGIGMEAAALERIFTPFEQANPSITREFGGLGLGLAIAQGTVVAHGGELRASSPGQGQGATFTVSLPLL